MKQSMIVVALLALAAPAYAQLGGILNKAQKIQEAKGKLDDLNVTEEEERTIGEQVSAKIRQRFGVVQDPAIHKYVTLVGTLLAQQSERPNLAWTFIVLDTDGVNAFASPGGIVHITRGALGLITSEAELAGVLAHEVGHVAHKHAVNAIRKGKAVQLGANETLSSRGPFLDKIANKAYDIVLENKFDRNDEMDSDKVSLTLAEKAGYAPGKLADFLTRLDERNKDQPASNGLFASSRYVPQVAGLGSTAQCPGMLREIAGYPNGNNFNPPLVGSETRGIRFVNGRAFVLQRSPPALVGFQGSTPTDVLETCGSPTFLDKYPDESPDPPETRLFVTCFADGEIYVYDPSIPRLVKTFLVGRGPSGLVFDKPRKVAYVVGFGDNNISVIDLDHATETQYHVVQRIGFPRVTPR